MSAPLWLLDVDGVLNAFDPAVVQDSGWDDWKTFTARGFVIRYSPEMVKRIAALHDSGEVEVRWLTTWGRYANEDLSEQFGFLELEVAAEQPFREPSSWWKLQTAQDLWQAGNSLIWTDDDIAFSSEANEWIHATGHKDLFAYAPKGVITREDLERIETWLEARNEADRTD